jgi:S-adenosyl-L-methionine hydrolase (adenosine-forming)
LTSAHGKSGAGRQLTPQGRRKPPIALLTDFGYRDHYVGVVKGVIASFAPDAKVIDVTHGIAPQAIAAGSLVLAQSWRYFPPRTIFVAVVDPGVGTVRRAIAIESIAGARFIGPDNGLLWNAANQAGIRRMVELTNARYHLTQVSTTFHGRDIFAPVAAHLWRGVRMAALGPGLPAMTPAAAGPAVTEGRNELTGSIVYIDVFGNLVTNIDRNCYERFASRFRGLPLSVRIGRRAPIEIVKAYGEARPGSSLATFGSFEMLEVAVRDGSAAERFAGATGAPVLVQAVRRS